MSIQYCAKVVIFLRKEWKAVMEFANGERNYAFADRRTKRREVFNQIDEAENVSGSRTKSAEDFYHKEHKEIFGTNTFFPGAYAPRLA